MLLNIETTLQNLQGLLFFMNNMMYTQVKLINGNSQITSWVETDKVLLNRKVTLSGLDGWWEITEIYQTLIKEKFDKLNKATFNSIIKHI